MVRSSLRTPTRAFVSLALFACSSTAFGNTTYDFSSVSSGFGQELFGASNTGIALSGITTVNLPIGFSSRTATYDIGFGAGGDFFQHWTNGRWTMSNNNGDGLYGSFAMSGAANFNYTFPWGTYPVLTGYYGTLTVGGGTGAYAGASGGGSFESYLGYLPSGYHSVNIDRLQVSVPDPQFGPPLPAQTDTRPISVLVLTGSENPASNTGHNQGPIISGGDGSLPALTHEVNDYTLVWPAGPPYVGHFLDTNDLGDSLEGTFFAPVFYPGRSDFGYGRGTGTFIGGTGAYAGIGGGSEYEVFSTGFGSFDDGANYDYMVITASRTLMMPAAPVPEPESWAMLLVGFGVLGAYRMRKVG